jgi:SAM-dependent methyltransferase
MDPNMKPSSSGLDAWIPRLLAVWRAARPGLARRGVQPPEAALLPDELREVVAGVKRLSAGLTGERDLVGERYMDDDRLLGAYLLFYWPTSYLQARGVLSELPHRPRSVLDLASGPGPMAFAALDAGASDAIVADRSARAIKAATALAAEAGEPLGTREWNPSHGRPLAQLAPGKKFDVVLMGHALNELFRGHGEAITDGRRADLLEQALALLSPGGSLVVVEPALRDTSRALLRVRDLLVARGYAIRAPCLFRGDCPALVKETDWCHAERPVEPPPLVAQISRAASLRREAVKMSYLVVAPKGEGWAEPPPGRLFRIVSEQLSSKGRLRYMGCGPEGRMGLALQEKHVTDANRRFEKLLRGDVIEITGGEPRGDGVALGEESAVRITAAAGKPVPTGKPSADGKGS